MKVTWNKDKRLSSSSGNYSDLTGVYASSDISCTNGDIIKLYNVSKGTNYNYVTANRTDGVITITVLHDRVTYLRVCNNGGIDPSTVRITKIWNCKLIDSNQ